MPTNIWNLKNTKQRLAIRQRTEAHKRHLLSLMNVKSKLINNRCGQYPLSPSQKFKSLNAPYNSRIRNTISRQNRKLADRLVNINHNKFSRIKMDSIHQKKFLNITQNLRAVSSIHRGAKFKQIQKQNNSMFNRLINTTPSLSVSRKVWVKQNRNQQLYRSNIKKSKYYKPDYSEQASRLIQRTQRNQPFTFKHLQCPNSSIGFPNLKSDKKRQINKSGILTQAQNQSFISGTDLNARKSITFKKNIKNMKLGQKTKTVKNQEKKLKHKQDESIILSIRA